MYVITYCHQKNPLRVSAKLHILFSYAWSSQRFKSLPSILCKIVVCTAGYLMKAGHLIQNTVSTGDLNRGRRTESRLLFGSFCRSKKNKTVPFRELSIAWKACPCRGSTLRVLLLPCRKLSRLPCRLRRISLLLSQQSFAASRHFPGRRDAASYLYTQSVCAACFASK